jgi:hypothetical protein
MLVWPFTHPIFSRVPDFLPTPVIVASNRLELENTERVLNQLLEQVKRSTAGGSGS